MISSILILYLSSSDLFSDKNGNLLKTGDVVKFETLADTLETIANLGADAFYTGKIAEDLVRDVQEAGIVRWIQSWSVFQLLYIWCLLDNNVIAKQSKRKSRQSPFKT